MKENFTREKKIAEISSLFIRAERENRNRLLEHEIYSILRILGIVVPEHIFIEKNSIPTEDQIKKFKASKLVLKVVSPDIVHKSDIGGVRFVEKNYSHVINTFRKMKEEIRRRTEKEIKGILICEAIPYEDVGFGSELILGLRSSLEFGPVVLVGLGGLDAELLNSRMKEGQGTFLVSAHMAEDKNLHRKLTGLSFYSKIFSDYRGRKALLKPDALIQAALNFAEIGSAFSYLENGNGFVIEEAEVNPLVIHQKRLVALDGVCRFSRNRLESTPRPYRKINQLLEPKTMGIIGVSEKVNLGRIILRNVIKQGFPKEKVTVVKPGLESIDGCRCVGEIKELTGTIDLFVITVSAPQVPQILSDLIENEKAHSVIIISGGMGEKEGTEDIQKETKSLIFKGRNAGKLVPVVNGGNCLGIYSRPGKYDTTFVPQYKLYSIQRKKVRKSNIVYLSQSGAFMISRMSKLAGIDPLYAVSLGNQIDLTVGDYLCYFLEDDRVEIVAVYVEGFQKGDGLVFAEAARKMIREKGKKVILYKGGRTPEARTAMTSHTASISGDYRLAREILEDAGVVMAENLFEFENLIKGFCFLGEKKVYGRKVALVTNAGFECVIMSDNLKNSDFLTLSRFSPEVEEKLARILAPLGIEKLQDINNPLDLTPVADDETFCRAAEIILEDENVDCAVVSPVPMTPAMNTLAAAAHHKENIMAEGSLAQRLIALFRKTEKPFIVNIDSGKIYQPLVDYLEEEGIPVFRRSDEAIKFLRRYITICIERKALLTG